MVAVRHCKLHDETVLVVVTIWSLDTLHHSVQPKWADCCGGKKRDEDGIAIHEAAGASEATLQVQVQLSLNFLNPHKKSKAVLRIHG